MLISSSGYRDSTTVALFVLTNGARYCLSTTSTYYCGYTTFVADGGGIMNGDCSDSAAAMVRHGPGQPKRQLSTSILPWKRCEVECGHARKCGW